MKVFESLKNKVFIITGGAGAGAGGTGAEIAKRLCENGAYSVIWDIAVKPGKELVQELQNEGKEALFIHCDVRDENEVKRALAKTMSVYGKVNGLVNNAFWHSDIQPPLHEMTLEDWDEHISINLRCHFIVCKYVIPVLLKQKESVILNIGSTGAQRGEDGYFAYDAAKAGLESLTRNIAAQYGREGLRCNCLVPGLIFSEKYEAVLSENPEARHVFGKMDRNNLLFCGHGTGSKAADAALFMLSDMSDYITAQTLVLDGGTISHCPQWADLRDANNNKKEDF